MSSIKRTLTDGKFWLGVGVGYVVVPMLMGKKTTFIKMPGAK